MNDTDFSEIEYGVKEAIATISLARPTARNGYTMRMSHELAAAFKQANADDAVRVVVLAAQGDDFCVGADLSGGSFDLTDASDASDPDFIEPAGRCAREIYAMDKPVIAAIQGRAVGAGSTIILPADFRFASTTARFGYVFTRRGIVPEGGSTWFLPRIVGHPTAVDWMLTGRVIEAYEALESGLVSKLYEPEELLPAAYALAAELVAKTAPVALALTRRLLYQVSPQSDPAVTHKVDSTIIDQALTSPDAIEGVTSFFERRDPKFPGRVSTDQPANVPWP